MKLFNLLKFSAAPAILAGAVFSLTSTPGVAQAQTARRPRLAVVIVVDQLRTDYLDRFDDLFLPAGTSGRDAGGFRYLRERGAQFPSARYKHFPLFTAPGHAVVSTGGYPYKTGIVGNEWFDVTTGKPMYSVADGGAKVVGDDANSGAAPMSPRNLRSSTLGDELKMATGGRGKVVSLALKDRPAILLGGRLSDASIWFDDSTGHWISSDFYCKTGKLPAWVTALNQRKLPASRFGQSWASSVSAASVASHTWKPQVAPPLHPVHGLGTRFPHPVTGGEAAAGKAYYKAWALTPWANQFVFDSAAQAVQSEALGADETPDLLAFNLSTNDYVGHAFGPDSPEVLDISVQTDRQLSQFFRFLDRTVPGGLASVTIALTADHGVSPVPEDLAAAGFRSGRIQETDVVAVAGNALSAKFGAGKWVLDYVEPTLYLNNAALDKAGASAQEAQQIAARAIAELDGVYNTYTRAQIETGALPRNDIGARISLGFHPKVSGDVMVITESNYFVEPAPFKNNTTHGTVYSYDTQVPMLFAGAGIRAGTYREDVGPADIAPSLAQILGISRPSACDGTPLVSAMK